MFKLSHSIFVMLQKEIRKMKYGYCKRTDGRSDGQIDNTCSPFGEHKKDVQCTITCAVLAAYKLHEH